MSFVYGALLTSARAPLRALLRTLLELGLSRGDQVFRDKRTTDPDQAMKEDATIADYDIAFPANLQPYGTHAYLPEISLVAAIFEDAVRCVQRASRGITDRQSSEALEWIASERHDWPFAFVNVCDFLGVDAKMVRTRLRLVGAEGSRGKL
jgi:hypothetical protein